jgi:hypothetical protein
MPKSKRKFSGTTYSLAEFHLLSDQGAFDQHPQQQPVQAYAEAKFAVTVNRRHFQIPDSALMTGTLQPVADRNNGDVELIWDSGAGIVSLHVHPNGVGGGSSLDGSVGAVPGNVPDAIVRRIMARADYAGIVASCTPTSRADVGSWR